MEVRDDERTTKLSWDEADTTGGARGQGERAAELGDEAPARRVEELGTRDVEEEERNHVEERAVKEANRKPGGVNT